MLGAAIWTGLGVTAVLAITFAIIMIDDRSGAALSPPSATAKLTTAPVPIERSVGLKHPIMDRSFSP